MKPRLRILLATAWAGLFLSSVAALINGLAGMRCLESFLGRTPASSTMALAVFLGGAAAGHYGMGRFADKAHRPLALFAWIEVTLGFYALLFPFYFSACSSAYESLIGHRNSAILAGLSEWMLVAAVLLIPSVLLGGILPILARPALDSTEKLVSRSAALFSLQSLGGSAGGILAIFWLIPSFGLASTIMGGAALHLLAGAAAFLVSARWETVILVSNPASQGNAVNDPALRQLMTPERLLAMVGAAVTSLAALVAWVAWNRLLALALGPTSSIFFLVLLAIAAGMAFGSGVYCFKRIPISSPSFFACILLAISLWVFLSMFFYDLMPWWSARWTRLLAAQPELCWLLAAGHVLLILGVVWPPAVGWGMTLPLATRMAAASPSQVGQSTGLILSASAVGALLGFVLGTWIFLPVFGLAKTISASLCLWLALSLALLGWNLPKRTRDRLAYGSLPIGIGLVLWGAFLSPRWQKSFSLGLRQEPNLPSSLSEYRSRAQSQKLDYYRDGPGASVGSQVILENGTPHRRWQINGQWEWLPGTAKIGSTLAAHLPLLLHTNPVNILLASGDARFCQHLLRHGTVRQLDVVNSTPEFNLDIEKQIQPPQAHTYAESARRYLLRAGASYDVIINRHARPWQAGELEFFSREFYEQCRRRLRPGGIMAQLMSLSESSDQVLDTIVATFTSVFPWASLWQTGAGEWMLVGSVRPLVLDLAWLEKRFEKTEVKADFERIDLLRLPVLLALEMVGQQHTQFVPEAGAPQQSDFYPALEWQAQYAFLTKPSPSRYRLMDERVSTRPTTWWGQYTAKHPLTENDYEALALGLPFQETGPLYQSLLEGWQKRFPATLLPVELYTPFLHDAAPGLLVASRLGPVLHSQPQVAGQRADLLSLYTQSLFLNYGFQRSMFHRPESAELRGLLEQLVALDPFNQRVYKLRLAELAWDEGRDDLCLKWGQTALHPDAALHGPLQFQLDPAAPGRVLTCMIEALWRAGDLNQAWLLVEEARRNGFANPNHQPRDPVLEMVCRKIQVFHAQATTKFTSSQPDRAAMSNDMPIEH